MKTTKKLLAMLLALTMILSLAVAVSADDTATGSITVTGDTTYTVYKMFNATVENGVTVYTVTPNWDDFLSAANVSTYLTKDANGCVYGIADHQEEADAAAIALLAVNYVNTKSLSSNLIASKDAPLENLEYGYYLLVAESGNNHAVVSITDTTPVEVKAKIEGLPKVEKYVQEDSRVSDTDEGWTDDNSADIGQDIQFKIVITTNEGASNYVLYDVMDSALSLETTSFTVQKITVGGNGTSTTTTLTAANDSQDNDYRVTVTSGNNAAYSFSISFTDTALNGLGNYDQVIVTYKAKLNSNATADKKYQNTAYLTHTAVNVSTDSATTTTWTGAIKVTKVDSTDTAKVLPGAKFALKNSEGKYYSYDADTKVVTWAEDPTNIETEEDGTLIFEGIDAGTYTLVETAAPAGYATPTNNTTTVTVSMSESASEGVTTYSSTAEQTITNTKGTTLPETGGMGTTIFYVLGGILMLAAVVVLVSKKRMTAE